MLRGNGDAHGLQQHFPAIPLLTTDTARRFVLRLNTRWCNQDGGEVASGSSAYWEDNASSGILALQS